MENEPDRGQKTTPELEVIIVSHGAWDLLSRCLASLREHPPSVATRVTVVDSGSTDDTPDLVAEHFPEVRLVRLENVGFSASNNAALVAGGSPMVLLLNPDTEVFEGSIDASIEALASHPEAGMVGIKLVTPDGSLDHACKRSFPTPLAALGHLTGLGRGEEAPAVLSQYRATDLGDDEPGEVDAINGAYMLVRREAIDQVGLLDEGYWMYGEDLDWCHRFWDAGWQVRYEPSGVALHVKGGTSDGIRSPSQEIAFHRAMGRFYRRYEAPNRFLGLNLLVYLGIGLRLLVRLIRTSATGRRSGD